MSSDSPAPYRLAPKALADMEDIWRYGAETWSVEQADGYVDELTRVFEAIAAMPTMARERMEFDPPVRIHAHQSHLIIYTVRNDIVVVLRVLGGRQNWQALLRAIEP